MTRLTKHLRNGALGLMLCLGTPGCGDEHHKANGVDPDSGVDAADAGAAGDAGPEGDASLPWGDTSTLQKALDGLAASELTEMDILGIGITVQLDDGRVFESAAGHIGPDADEAEYDVRATKQVIGSITKLYTAAMLMQLAEDGKVSLDDTADRWFTIPKADAITVRMLLNHTSGLNDCLGGMTAEDYKRAWTPQQLVERAVKLGAWTAPGSKLARYSNTNFVLLAMIVEAETGKSWSQNVVERITKPLGLTHTSYAGDAKGRANLVDGWVHDDAGWHGALAQVDPTIGWGMGALVSTNHELAQFTKALLTGALFSSPDTLAKMLDFSVEMDPASLAPGEPPQRIGLCITRYEVDDLQLDGHIGHILGYNTATFRDPKTKALITVTANTDNAITGLTAIKVAQYLRAR